MKESQHNCRKYNFNQLHIQKFRQLTPLTLMISCNLHRTLIQLLIAFSANSGFMCASMVKNSCVLAGVSYCSYWPWHVWCQPYGWIKASWSIRFCFPPTKKNTRLLWFRTFMNFPNDSPLSERTGFGEIFTGSSHWQSTGAPSWMEPLHDTNDFWV